MSAAIPTVEPVRIYSGVTTEWTRDIADYVASTYTLKYRFIGPSNIAVTATTSGTGYLVTITAATAALFIAGQYRLVGWVETTSDASEKRIVYEGNVEIVYDPTTQAADSEGVETRSFWRRVRDNLRDIIEGKSTQSSSSYQISGRNVSRMTWDEILRAYNQATEMVAQEERQEALARNEDASRNIGFKFSRP